MLATSVILKCEAEGNLLDPGCVFLKYWNYNALFIYLLKFLFKAFLKQGYCFAQPTLLRTKMILSNLKKMANLCKHMHFKKYTNLFIKMYLFIHNKEY